MKQFDIIMYKGNSFLAKLIRKISKSKQYSHCAFYLGNFMCLELAWNNPCVIMPFKYKSHEYDVYRLNIDLTEDEINKLENYITKYFNSGYDFKYLITRGLNILFGTKIRSSESKMTCDEIILESFRHIGINLIEGDIVITPELLSKSPLLRKIN